MRAKRKSTLISVARLAVLLEVVRLLDLDLDPHLPLVININSNNSRTSLREAGRRAIRSRAHSPLPAQQTGQASPSRQADPTVLAIPSSSSQVNRSRASASAVVSHLAGYRVTRSRVVEVVVDRRVDLMRRRRGGVRVLCLVKRTSLVMPREATDLAAAEAVQEEETQAQLDTHPHAASPQPQQHPPPLPLHSAQACRTLTRARLAAAQEEA